MILRKRLHRLSNRVLGFPSEIEFVVANPPCFTPAQLYLGAEATDREELGDGFEANLHDAINCYEKAIAVGLPGSGECLTPTLVCRKLTPAVANSSTSSKD